MPLCGLYDGGDSCEVRGERRYKDGWRCPRHTPAALAGHPEPPIPDPALSAAGLQLREDWKPRRDRVYGTATTDPLGRDGPGGRKGNNGLPVRVTADNDKGDRKR